VGTAAELAVATRFQLVVEQADFVHYVPSDRKATCRDEVTVAEVGLDGKSQSIIILGCDGGLTGRELEVNTASHVPGVVRLHRVEDRLDPVGLDGHVRINEKKVLTVCVSYSFIPGRIRTLCIAFFEEGNERRMVIGKRPDDLPGVVCRCVVDREDLVATVRVGLCCHGLQSPLDSYSVVVDGTDHRNEWRGAVAGHLARSMFSDGKVVRRYPLGGYLSRPLSTIR